MEDLEFYKQEIKRLQEELKEKQDSIFFWVRKENETAKKLQLAEQKIAELKELIKANLEYTNLLGKYI